MRQHHLLLLGRHQRSKRHLDSVQSLKEPRAVVSELLFQLQCLELKCLDSNSESQYLSAVAILGRIILCCGGSPVHCGKFSSMPGLCPFGISSDHQLWQPKISQDISKCPLGDKWPWLGGTILRWFSVVVTGCCCLHPIVQNVIAWPR